MNFAKSLPTSALLGGLILSAQAFAMGGNQITPGLHAVEVMHKGQKILITRSDEKDATIPKAFSKSSRHCPPFCIQPIDVAPGVETIGELEVLGYLKRIGSGDRKVMVVDSRSPEWIIRGTIPGSVNIPWNKINHDAEGGFELATEATTINEILQNKFSASLNDGIWDFRNAKTLVLFCNGFWCGQSSINIKTLLKLGYPAYKLKWYRGGMQSWVAAGLTTANN